MILAMGLLDASATAAPGGKYDAETAYASGIAVWTKYRRSLGKAGMIFDELRERIRTRTVDDPKRFDIPGIATIAVWDTVGSLGIPLYGIDFQRADLFNFADRALSPRVQVGLHAVSIDERRDDFIPTLWDARDGVTQVWFAGAHSDVGGGYPETVLSDISLDWMIRQLTKCGLQFNGDPIPLSDPYVPHHTPWAENPFDRLAQSDRKLPADVRFHQSVQARLTGYGDYKPAALQTWLGQGRNLPANLIWID